MITLKSWMEVVEYRITEGSEYQWDSFGRNAYSLDSWNGDYEGYTFGIIFDTKTQTVYCVQACDYKNNRAYRMMNPDYKSAYAEECTKKGDVDIAWDGVKYIDLELEEDWINKAKAIKDGIDYDTRVSIPIDLPDNELMFLFKRAHEADMTFNEYVEKILRRALHIE